MKKFFLILLLLILIIGVSYIKTVREKEQKQAAFDAGASQSQSIVKEFQNRTDSLITALTDHDKQYADSLKNIDLTRQTEIDSLSNVLVQKDSAITALAQKTKTVPVDTEPKTTAAKTLSLHEKVLAYYKNRYDNLPNDLSDYEKKIALAEIREETAGKFKITVAQLNKIRNDNKLNY